MTPAYTKHYPFDRAVIEQESSAAFAFQVGDEIAGFIAGRYEAWNRRFVITQVAVEPAYRRRGIARALISAMEDEADRVGARCLFAETQNTNYPAVLAYQALGFRICGIDTSLYDHRADGRNEIAIFLTKPVRLRTTEKKSRSVLMRELPGADFYKRIGQKGGQVSRDKGIDMVELGRAGGKATLERNGPDHFRVIGQEGGFAGRGTKKPGAGRRRKQQQDQTPP